MLYPLLIKFFTQPIGIRLDLSIPGNVAKLVSKTIEAYGKIDILVNNVGIAQFAKIQDKNFNQVYREQRIVNEEAPLELTRLCVPYIVKTNGTIIFIASILARNPVRRTFPFFQMELPLFIYRLFQVMSTGGYSMGKNSLVALALTLTHDLGPNVRVNVIRLVEFDLLFMTARFR